MMINTRPEVATIEAILEEVPVDVRLVDADGIHSRSFRVFSATIEPDGSLLLFAQNTNEGTQ